MNRLNSTQLAFLDRFQKTPDARVLVEILDAELRAVEKELHKLTGDPLLWAQGKAQQLDWLIDKLSAGQPSKPAAVPPRRLGVNFDQA
jgi:hypothetical protein